jgi:hypothetical protein
MRNPYRYTALLEKPEGKNLPVRAKHKWQGGLKKVS